ncbi:hypothetical protein P168DRAFT_171017 [Aspergillus campestris IBT 28561]|uniref:Uncharacterized protein n=1 Tax=Aspergillus campestris (strain IBT 28561) TaxID=1392248 RepID=A0A2I1D1Y7_ASPC2|nr:uncharacterized protein P168DRAFT_171017 [Aspergillus campestris IBT 28561]PKY03868.1 hypothetical protein P168DRAFT_171017 [Aspergillus campestris IBT 28561]
MGHAVVSPLIIILLGCCIWLLVFPSYSLLGDSSYITILSRSKEQEREKDVAD